MRKIIIGVMGPGAAATPENLTAAYELGKAIAARICANRSNILPI